MKVSLLYIAIIFLLCTIIQSCNDEKPTEPTTEIDFAVYFLNDNSAKINEVFGADPIDLKLSDVPWFTQDDIEFYDWSSHCIYLKRDKSYLFDEFDTFDLEYFYTHSLLHKPFVLVSEDTPSYIGYFQGVLASSPWPLPEIIDIEITQYPKDLLHIDWPYTFASDLRDDTNVKEALRNLGILHEGIKVSIDSLWIQNADTATIEYQVSIINEDNLYVLDPEKIGTSEFQYFNNGPTFYNYTINKIYTAEYRNIPSPDIVGNFNEDWFTLIESGKSIERKIQLKGYPEFTPGNYYSILKFSNPPDIPKESRYLSNARYWLGATRSEIIEFRLDSLDSFSHSQTYLRNIFLP